MVLAVVLALIWLSYGQERSSQSCFLLCARVTLLERASALFLLHIATCSPGTQSIKQQKRLS
jgi:hypothetical protein